MDDERAWFVGVDWASKAHVVAIVDRQGRKVAERSFDHGGAGLAAMADWIFKVTGAPPEAIEVAIEVPHGPVVESLMERGFRMRAINPKQLDRFRDRFSPAGAKDDSRDAEVLADALRTDPRAFRQLAPADPVAVELREWSRITTELTQERTRLANRLREQLWRYYPQILEVNDDVAADWFLELWARVPTPDHARRVREDTIARLLKRRRIRRFDAASLLALLRAPAIAVAAGTVEAATAHIKVLAKRVSLVNSQLAEAHSQLDRLTKRFDEAGDAEPGQMPKQRDAAILASQPGLARIGVAALLAEAPDALRERDYHALRCLCGSAPVTRQSGKTKIVVRRRAVNPRLANAVYHWARAAVQHDQRSRAKYTALRQRGHGHARALRSVVDRLLKVTCVMLEKQTMYDPDYHTKPKVAA